MTKAELFSNSLYLSYMHEYKSPKWGHFLFSQGENQQENFACQHKQINFQVCKWNNPKVCILYLICQFIVKCYESHIKSV